MASRIFMAGKVDGRRGILEVPIVPGLIETRTVE